MKDLIKQINTGWLILAFLFGLVIWYAGVNSRLAQAEDDINNLKLVSSQINDLKIKIERIDTSVEFIKQQVK